MTESQIITFVALAVLIYQVNFLSKPQKYVAKSFWWIIAVCAVLNVITISLFVLNATVLT